MKYNVVVIVTIYFTLSQVLHASKSECTYYYVILEEINIVVTDNLSYTFYEPVVTNQIDWVELKNQSQDAYDEIRGYSDCILEISDCQGKVTDNCQNLHKTNNLGTHEFITSTSATNYTHDPLITYTTESMRLDTELATTNHNLITTTTKNNFASESDHIDTTTENTLNSEFSVGIFHKNSNCTKNATSTINNCDDDDFETTTLSLECDDTESDDCEVEATGNVTISETSTKLPDFNVIIKFDPTKRIQNKTNIDITSICNKSISLNNKSNEYSLKCKKIDEATTISPFIDKAVVNNTTEKVYTKPVDFSVILVYHNEQCTYNGTELDITSKCHKVTNLRDGTFSLECQVIKDYCHDNQSEFDIDSTDGSASSRMNTEKERKRNNLIMYIVIGVAAAVGGIFVLAMIAKFVTNVQSGAFHVPDNPYYTHPEFRDDILEDSV